MSDLTDYSFEQKERLARRIQKLKKRRYLSDIESIIIKHNPNLDITTNPSGKFMYFQDLKKETYYALDKYVRKILKFRTLSETSENTQYSSELTKYSEGDDDPFSNNPKLRYSNKERNLIKRKLYDKHVNDQGLELEQLNKQEEISNTLLDPEKLQDSQIQQISQNNVFVKRSTPKVTKTSKKIINFDP